MTPVKPTDERLQAYLDDELSPVERDAVDTALADSEALRADLARLRATNQLARRGAQPALPSGLEARLRTIAAQPPRRWWEVLLPGRTRPRQTLVWGWGTTLALALLLLPPQLMQAREKARSGGGGELRTASVPAPEYSPKAAEAVVPADSAKPADPELVVAKPDGAAPSAGAPPGAPASPPVAAPTSPPAAASPAPSRPLSDARGRVDAVAGIAAKVALRADSPGYAGVGALNGTPAAVRGGGPSGYGVSTSVPPPPPVEPLKAGETDDNATLGKYIAYLEGYHPPNHAPAFSPRERYLLQVVGEGGLALPDAELTVGEAKGLKVFFTARADSSGQAVLFPEAVGKLPETVKLTAHWRQFKESKLFTRSHDQATWRLTLPTRPRIGGMTLDLAFVVDTTGSMSEEIDRIRETIGDVAERIGSLPQQPLLRLGLVLYRDRGDVYVTKSYSFAPLAKFQAALQNVQAEGGGDTPEDVNNAIRAAVDKLEWGRAPGLRLAFLVGDAPPHLDYHDEPAYLRSALSGVGKGIKWFTVSCSDEAAGPQFDDLREYVWRQLALVSRGRFLFVTRRRPNEPDNPATDFTPHHVARQDYTVQALPDLVVKCVARELAHLGTKPEDEPQVTLPPSHHRPQSRPAPVESRPSPRPYHESRPGGELPLWAVLLVLVLNLGGWLYAYRRSVRPLR